MEGEKKTERNINKKSRVKRKYDSPSHLFSTACHQALPCEFKISLFAQRTKALW